MPVYVKKLFIHHHELSVETQNGDIMGFSSCANNALSFCVGTFTDVFSRLTMLHAMGELKNI